MLTLMSISSGGVHGHESDRNRVDGRGSVRSRVRGHESDRNRVHVTEWTRVELRVTHLLIIEPALRQDLFLGHAQRSREEVCHPRGLKPSETSVRYIFQQLIT